MAFTGTAVYETVASNLVRITGLSLAAGASGTIGLFGDGTADENLPDNFNPVDYGDVTVDEAVEVGITAVTAATTAEGASFVVTKTTGPFQIDIAHLDGANASAEMEIFVRYH